jgi:MerR family transcriptional regulator, copper efflux regulator
MLVQEKSKQIGVVAKESGVPIKTIRYYEELGLLKSSGRTEGGFRLFNTDVLARLHFIKRAHIKTKLEDKVQAIDYQIQQLLVLRQDLSAMLSGWEIQSETYHSTICPIIT